MGDERKERLEFLLVGRVLETLSALDQERGTLGHVQAVPGDDEESFGLSLLLQRSQRTTGHRAERVENESGKMIHVGKAAHEAEYVLRRVPVVGPGGEADDVHAVERQGACAQHVNDLEPNRCRTLSNLLSTAGAQAQSRTNAADLHSASLHCRSREMPGLRSRRCLTRGFRAHSGQQALKLP